MRFTETPIPGALLVDIEPVADERGFFARTVCRDEFARHGANADFAQQSISFNNRRGIVRGLHWQTSPHQEEKFVRVSLGAIFDAIVDLRPHSPTYKKWFTTELSSENRRGLFVPKGVAHGYQTLTDASEVCYQMTIPYQPGASRVLRWNDPEIGIVWPAPREATFSPKDGNAPTLDSLINDLQ